MLWAAVPKAPVDKYRHSLFSKYEVWPTGKVQMSAPASQPVQAEEENHSQLGIAIAATANASHYGGPFVRGENISHAAPSRNKTLARRRLCGARPNFVGLNKTLQLAGNRVR